MRKFTATLLAAALIAPVIATPAMAAPGHSQSQSHSPDRREQPGHQKSGKGPQFRKGEKFDRSRATHYQVVDYRKYRNVKAPPKGYHYVRSGNDMLLVGVTSGIVAAVTSGMFR
jgi:Ni/Co efflux regulator RcnB